MNRKEIRDSSIIYNTIYIIQFIGVKLLFFIFKLLGYKISSLISSIMLIILGFTVFIKRTILSYKNIKMALKIKSNLKIFKIIIGMWSHFGRCVTEFILFSTEKYSKASKYIILDNESKNTLKKISKDENGKILVSAHFGFWEALGAVFPNYDIKISVIYQKMNNGYLNNFIVKSRTKYGNEIIPKGRESVIKIVKALKKGRALFMLVDQRLTKGINVPFFNIPAKTTESPSVFALKNNYKIYLFYSVRKKWYSSKFICKIKEFNIIKTGNEKQDIITNTININKEIEKWIKKNPEQYFWVHNRWKK